MGEALGEYRAPVEVFFEQKRTDLYDGAHGTFLAPFVEPGTPPDLLNLTSDGRAHVADLAKAYYDAGAVMSQTNTFRGNMCALGRYGLDERDVYQLNLLSAQTLRSVAGSTRYVAGDIGPTGLLLASDRVGDAYEYEVREAVRPQVKGLLDGGADVLHIETQSSAAEVQAIIEEIRATRRGTPIIVTMTFERRNSTRPFRTQVIGKGTGDLVALADEYGLLAYGANCGLGPDGSGELVDQLRREHPDAVLVMKLNAGMPIMVNDQEVYPKSPSDMGHFALQMADMGVRLVGACCGSTPEHIQAMNDALHR